MNVNQIVEYAFNKHNLSTSFESYKKISLLVCDYALSDDAKEIITKQLFPTIVPFYPVTYEYDRSKFTQSGTNYEATFLRKYISYKIDSCENVSPVDGMHIETNKLANNRMFINNKPIDVCRIFNAAVELINYKYDILYLTYKDYHYVHFPFDCKVLSITNVPGKYSWMEPSIEFGCKFLGSNYRKIYKLKKNNGDVCYLIMIASIIVGGINTLFYDETLPISEYHTTELNNVFCKKGDFLANFYIGSMVCVLYPSTSKVITPFSLTKRVQMGRRINY